MYHFRGVTLSFTKRKWQTYECLVSKAPWRGGSPPPFGRVGVGFTLHRNTLSSKKLHHTVKFFYLLQHLYNTTFHTSRNVSSFIYRNIYSMKYLAVWKYVCTFAFSSEIKRESMEQQLEKNNQQRSLFRSHPQMYDVRVACSWIVREFWSLLHY
jgi:hypothetical protein